jgi:hypothetical protein
MDTFNMRFAKVIFNIAGVYGIIVLLPHYFLEAKTGRDYPPPITHPEYFYGFVGVALAWQVLFLVIATHPARYRLAMIPAMLEKFSFAIAVTVLFMLGRVAPIMLVPAGIDLLFGLLFVIALLKTSRLSC